MSDTASPQPPAHKAFYLTRIAIKTIEVGIETQFKKEGKDIPEGREMLRLAFAKYRSSIENGVDNHLGTAKPLT